MVDMVEALMEAFIQELDRRLPKEVQQVAEGVWIENVMAPLIEYIVFSINPSLEVFW